MEITSVLVEYEDLHQTNTCGSSGLLIDNKFVIVTANLLANLLRTENLRNNIFYSKRCFVDPSEILSYNPTLNVILNIFGNKIEYRNGSVFTTFVSKSIRDSCQKTLRNWSIDTEDCDSQMKELLSLFLVINIQETDGTNLEDDFKNVVKRIVDDLDKQFYVGMDLCVDSSPFGNRHFFNTYTRGIVSNILGHDDCLILTDCPTAAGSEGGLVLNLHTNKPIGIVLSSLSWVKGEWVGLTLITALHGIFKEMLRDSDSDFQQQLPKALNYNELYGKISKSIARVVCGLNWGSSVLLNKEKGIFISNTHVVENFDECVICWEHLEFPAKIIFRTSIDDSFDLAVLQVDSSELKHTDMKSAELAKGNARNGDDIFAIGYPLFAKDIQRTPTLTKGYVSKASPVMLKTTSTVLAGSSGGGLFTNDGSLAGIIVANTKLEENKIIYPRINVAIPVSVIYSTIKDYMANEDLNVFQKLANSNSLADSEWNLLTSKL